MAQTNAASTPERPVYREQKPIFYPKDTEFAEGRGAQKAALVILGRSGSGKSHLVRQLLLDPDYGPDEVLILMAEDSRQTYNFPKIHFRRVHTFDQGKAVVEELARASARGERLPKVIVYDSMSGSADYTRRAIRSIEDKSGNAIRSGFGDLGYNGMDIAIDLRDSVNTDIVLMVTTSEGVFNAMPELAVEGKLLPKNITRLSGSTLYLKSVEVKVPETDISRVVPAAHRTIATDEFGKPLVEGGFGRVINRYFFTMDVGEVMAKGHHALNFQERAILPDVLRKIHAAAAQEVK